MNPIDIIEEVYRVAAQPVAHVRSLATELQHWYQAFPANNYLQPCVIDGKAALVCKKHLGDTAPQAFRALKAICGQYGIFLKEDSRAENRPSHIAHNRRKLAVVLTYCLTMASAAQAANLSRHTLAGASLVATQSVSLVIKKQMLSDVTLKIASETGIRFKFNVAVQNDLITKKLDAQDWKGALGQLLASYNYSTIQEGNVIKTVFITGYKGGVKPPANEDINRALPDTADTDQLTDFLVNQEMVDITLPTDELANLPEGSDMLVDLPVGAFIVRQESMVALEDGTLSWVGTMDDENQFYRLYLTRAEDGEVIGNIFTPDGAYNIETIDGQTVMVAVDQISMRTSAMPE